MKRKKKENLGRIFDVFALNRRKFLHKDKRKKTQKKNLKICLADWLENRKKTDLLTFLQEEKENGSKHKNCTHLCFRLVCISFISK